MGDEHTDEKVCLNTSTVIVIGTRHYSHGDKPWAVDVSELVEGLERTYAREPGVFLPRGRLPNMGLDHPDRDRRDVSGTNPLLAKMLNEDSAMLRALTLPFSAAQRSQMGRKFDVASPFCYYCKEEDSESP